jgi:hypothetical protein
LAFQAGITTTMRADCPSGACGIEGGSLW